MDEVSFMSRLKKYTRKVTAKNAPPASISLPNNFEMKDIFSLLFFYQAFSSGRTSMDRSSGSSRMTVRI